MNYYINDFYNAHPNLYIVCAIVCFIMYSISVGVDIAYFANKDKYPNIIRVLVIIVPIINLWGIWVWIKSRHPSNCSLHSICQAIKTIILEQFTL